MSDYDAVPVSTSPQSPEAFRQTLGDYDAIDADQRASNKVALLDALAAAGITHAVVTFDGYGDSGQIESVEARAGDMSIELPDTNVGIIVAEWGNPLPIVRDMPVADAVERLVYDYLGYAHAGWENNDGAYGEFIFDVAEGPITLDHNERFTKSEDYVHAF